MTNESQTVQSLKILAATHLPDRRKGAVGCSDVEGTSGTTIHTCDALCHSTTTLATTPRPITSAFCEHAARVCVHCAARPAPRWTALELPVRLDPSDPRTDGQPCPGRARGRSRRRRRAARARAEPPVPFGAGVQEVENDRNTRYSVVTLRIGMRNQ